MKRLDKSELIFKIIAYTLVTLFAISTLYPLVYSVSAAISSRTAVESGQVTLLPINPSLEVFKAFFTDDTYSKKFWISYTNTLFYTFYGTIFSMGLTIFAAYALSKSNLLFKKQINFFIVFTMWFSAGIMPTYLNYLSLGINNRWGIIYGFGVQAFNIILLRNYFNSVSKEIEEAAIVDGASEMQILKSVYLPMSKSALATVTLFYALSRWNGYFWNMRLVGSNEHPLQVILRGIVDDAGNTDLILNYSFSLYSLSYAAIVLSIIPIIIVYPILQKYMSQGVNTGGVKE
ncbi:ABC transporter, permease protein [Alteracholeplasma palmae J233]|uniref:ABC transporter, permease protein n=1 Tax=Alteracholeplasma palmae (strain ATCC 49389 / J233) TaxID=1318466 RepID=U4KRE4_ALTPJ|nr:carbohydrate ABC transporter permease [Alteracholeplasma palmae]CCV64091.1 ABC transporter, permease protein [Alteracholeplasma palmae J233]